MRTFLVLFPFVASACRSNPATPPPAVELASVQVRDGVQVASMAKQELADTGDGEARRVMLLRVDPTYPWLRHGVRTVGEQMLFYAIDRDPARSLQENLGRVKLALVDPRDPFLSYFDVRPVSDH